MAVSTRSVGAALGAIVGKDAVADDRTALSRGAIDGRLPRWIVRASSVEHVAGVLSLACDEGLAVVPCGSASALALGYPPARVDVVLDLARLDRILEWNPEDLTATVEAGVTLGALTKHLGPRRQFLPLDPPAGAGRTLGGVAATNAIGPLRASYGGMRDLLLGVRFVQADGVVTWGGAKVVKSVSGYDVPKLMVGALGTLGVICELTLRLHPLPEVERTWLVAFGAPEHAQAFVWAIVDSALQPSRVEWLDANALDRLGASPAAAAIAISIGSVEAAVGAQGEVIRALAGRERGHVVDPPDDWWQRHAGVLGNDSVVLRVATLASEVGRTVAEVARVLPRATVSGCASVGSLHVSTDADDAEAERAVTSLRASVEPTGGHVVVERASSAVREALDPWGAVDEGAFGLMRAIKSEFDPKRVLNPGRFVGRL
jgi:glycolate dehydrogenase FAD-binding subunit